MITLSRKSLVVAFAVALAAAAGCAARASDDTANDPASQADVITVGCECSVSIWTVMTGWLLPPLGALSGTVRFT